MKENRMIQMALMMVSAIGCQASHEPAQKADGPKDPINIIFMIGDGMGLSQLSSAYFFGESEPNFSRFTTVGLSRTSSSSHKITDSAAGATAFACGQKTYNGALGLASDSSELRNITEELSEKGWNTGLVCTSAITHATPAAFYAHVVNRGMQEDIAKQLVHSNIDFFAGGGYDWFANRSDSVNYLDSLKAYDFLVDTVSISDTQAAKDGKPAYLLAPDGMKSMSEGRGDFLSQATDKAIAFLSSKKEPFFLMVEGSQIDWGCHANSSEYVIGEVLNLDKAVGVALDFAMKQGNTLVIVTADHETGGFTLAGTPKGTGDSRSGNDYNNISPSFSSNGHSGTMVPVLSYGPEAENLQGIFQNTHMNEVFRQVAGLK